jgi:hypothetical protein
MNEIPKLVMMRLTWKHGLIRMTSQRAAITVINQHTRLRAARVSLANPQTKTWQI